MLEQKGGSLNLGQVQSKLVVVAPQTEYLQLIGYGEVWLAQYHDTINVTG